MDCFDNMLRIFAAVSGQEVMAIPVEGLGNVRALKVQLQGLCGVPRFRQCLIHNGKVLEDSMLFEAPFRVELVLLPFSPASSKQVAQLVDAATHDRVSQVEEILQRPQDPNLLADAHVEGWRTSAQAPLHAAAMYGRVEVARLLLEARADVDQPDEGNQTPLLLACSRSGEVPVVRLLLQARADTSSALLVATREGSTEAVCSILQAGADVNQVDALGVSPLWAASAKNYVQIADCLLDAKANKDQTDHDGATPLWAASCMGHVEAVRLLLAAGAKHDRVNHRGESPLSVATREGETEVVVLLLTAGDQED
ncbi:mask [Symbiodinium natans]|uniref:Mask protein n=1 Tax=Symbiodinium natans TaxID=878477 RepID=A0A812KZH3_9DINO|nr:mask [Symbiodinium natans]